ncbi:hypothetical protein [Musicola paradisiaca]|nr:hypothetical protein [Musicola paradisiaca]
MLNRDVSAPGKPLTARDSLAVIGMGIGILMILIEKIIQSIIFDTF